MKRKQSTEEQIITILKEAEAGAKVGDLIRRHGIAEGTYYRWKNQIRRHGRERCQAPQADGGGKPPSQALGR